MMRAKPAIWRTAPGLILLSIALLMGGAGLPVEAQTAGEQRFEAAVKGFQDGWHEFAEAEFGRFILEQPASNRIPEAVLLQAQARFRLRQYDRVIELLRTRWADAGGLADRYRYWMAQAQVEQGDYSAAAATYADLLKDFPASSLRIEAAYGQAYAAYKAGELGRAVQLLRDPGGIFQGAAAGSTNVAVVCDGYLLLAEALRAQNDHKMAEQALQELAAKAPNTEVEWQRQYLLASIEWADRRSEAALQRATNLVQLARSAGDPLFHYQSLRLHARILEADAPDRAIEVYDQIVQLKGVPAEEQRKALLKMVNLSANAGPITNAIGRLEAFIAQNSTDSAVDLLRLTLGELHLKRFDFAAAASTSATNRVELATMLRDAQAQFEIVINTFTNSPYVGSAYLNRGWAYWKETWQLGESSRLAEALKAFRAAAERLPRTESQAIARMKVGDCLVIQQDFSGAITNYEIVLNQYPDVPRVKEAMAEQALYQIIRAAVEGRQFDRARSALAKQMADFPEGAWTDDALLALGRGLLRAKQCPEARDAFQQLAARFPNSALKPEAELGIAQTFVEEGNWINADEQYRAWLSVHTNSEGRVQVEFDRAWVQFRSGRETNALALFTNLVTRFPTNHLAPVAQYWVGDYYFRQGDFAAAELSYQSKVFSKATNSPTRELAYQAELMAALSAFKREGFPNARGYLTNLINERSCPAAIVPDAYFLLGNVFVEEGTSAGATNSLRDFENALVAFNVITNLYATNRLAPLALGRIGDCHFQLASQDPKRYEDATNAYGRLLESPLASVAVRSQGEVGLAMVLEKMAALRPEPERAALLNRALYHYQSVVYGSRLRADLGEKASPFWVKEAGLAGGRLAESMQKRAEALELYKRLREMIPSLRATWDKRIAILAATGGEGRP